MLATVIIPHADSFIVLAGPVTATLLPKHGVTARKVNQSFANETCIIRNYSECIK